MTQYFKKHFCLTSEWYRRSCFFLIDIIHTEYIQIFSATVIHRKHRNHKIQKHAFRWSLWHCSSQHYRHTFFPFETALCNVFLSTAERLWAFTTTRIVTHLHLPTKCWLCKAWVRMTGGSENVSSQHYPVSQSGVIISLLMAKWCSSCQEHRENDCLVSTMFSHNSNIVTHDKITKDFLGIFRGRASVVW